MLDNLFLKQLEIQGQNVLLNDKEIKVVLKDIDSSKSVPTGKIFSADKLENGDILTINDIKYIIIDSYKQKNKSYYIGEYIMAFLVYYTTNTSFKGSPKNNKSTYGAVSKISDITQNGTTMSITDDKYTIILNKNVVGLDFNIGKLSTCGSTYSIKAVDKAKKDLYYYTVEFTEYYKLEPDVYRIELTTDKINLNQISNTYQIDYKLYLNDELIEKDLTYEYDNTYIDVSSKGLITVKEITESQHETIQIKCKYGNAENIFTVNLSYEDVYNISISPNSITLVNGATYQLNPICTKNGVTVDNPNLTYSCDNSNVTISDTGLITVIGTEEEQNSIIEITYMEQKATFNLTISKIEAERYEVTSDNSRWRNKYAIRDNVDCILYKGNSLIFKIVEKGTSNLCLDKYDIHCYSSGDYDCPDNDFMHVEGEGYQGWYEIHPDYSTEITVTDNNDGTFTITNTKTKNFKWFLIKLTNTVDKSILYVRVKRDN